MIENLDNQTGGNASGISPLLAKFGDGEKMVKELLADGPMSSRAIISSLYPYHLDSPELDDEKLSWAIKCALSCPGTWQIPIGDDNGLVGLDSQPKPGNGTTEAAAEYLGLAKIEGVGGYVPKKYLNG